MVGYRVHGHLAAKLDPLGLAPRNPLPLNPGHYGLTAADFDREVMTTFGGRDSRPMRLRELIDRLNRTYCGHIGFEYMHIADRNVREWIQQRIESDDIDRSPSRDMQLRILTRLTDAVIFEEFVRKKYLGATTFSLEGSETLVPLLDLALEAAARRRRDRSRHGDGPPRPAERAGQYLRQAPGRYLPRIRRSVFRLVPRSRRREISPRRQRRLARGQRLEAPRLALLQSEPSWST